VKLLRLSFVVLVLGTNKLPRCAQRRELRAAISNTGTSTWRASPYAHAPAEVSNELTAKRMCPYDDRKTQINLRNLVVHVPRHLMNKDRDIIARVTFFH